jgi:hypothetical protein
VRTPATALAGIIAFLISSYLALPIIFAADSCQATGLQCLPYSGLLKALTIISLSTAVTVAIVDLILSPRTTKIDQSPDAGEINDPTLRAAAWIRGDASYKQLSHPQQESVRDCKAPLTYNKKRSYYDRPRPAKR